MINKKNIANPTVNILHIMVKISKGINQDSKFNVDELVTDFITSVEFISIQMNKTRIMIMLNIE
jgi:hypothetical protein